MNDFEARTGLTTRMVESAIWHAVEQGVDVAIVAATRHEVPWIVELVHRELGRRDVSMERMQGRVIRLDSGRKIIVTDLGRQQNDGLGQRFEIFRDHACYEVS